MGDSFIRDGYWYCKTCMKRQIAGDQVCHCPERYRTSSYIKGSDILANPVYLAEFLEKNGIPAYRVLNVQ